jgi:endonuclease/exonuclease/phosphatase family metal-dependent hydrolase
MDFAQLLGPTYAHVGVGRDDGVKAGEYSCIFYDRTKFEEIKWKTIWLSPTPDVPGSKGWDAVSSADLTLLLHQNWPLKDGQDCVRIATFLSLRMRETGEVLYVINTHYDHRGFQARAESSRTIREHAFEWVTEVEEELGLVDKHRGPVILMGDLSESRTVILV